MIYQQHLEMEEDQQKRDEMECNSRKMNAYIHSQIMRIREEDSQLGEDIAKKLRERGVVNQDVASVFMLSRPILPASPLSGKTAIKSAN